MANEYPRGICSKLFLKSNQHETDKHSKTLLFNMKMIILAWFGAQSNLNVGGILFTVKAKVINWHV